MSQTKTAMIRVRCEEDLKNRVLRTAEAAHLDVSDIVRMALRTFLRSEKEWNPHEETENTTQNGTSAADVNPN
jgi:antitoxin component of RelBE/YafQ-DinJ toxin-antitoxin module